MVGNTLASMSNTRVLTVKLPRELSAKVARAARKRGASRSQIVREAIQSMREEGPTVGDLAGDLRGVVRGRPPDLSSNPKHMKGYGR
jgi:hypothetical protein